MRQKSYTFEHADGASDHVKLHRKGHKFHILARLMCLILAVIFWLFVHAWQNDTAPSEALSDDSTVQQTQAD